MWSNIAKLASTPRKASSSVKGKQLAKEDPLTAFTRGWDQILTILSIPERQPLQQSPIPRLLDQVLNILITESTTPVASSSTGCGLCLEDLLKSGALAQLVKLVTPDEPAGVRREVLRWYGKAIKELDEGFLIHGAVSRPLVKLLRSCVEVEGGLMRGEEQAVVDVMRAISSRIRTFPELLVIFFRERHHSNTKDGPSRVAAALSGATPSISIGSPELGSDRPSSPTPSNSTVASTSQTAPSYDDHIGGARRRKLKTEHDFLIFAYLLRFVHREGQVGDLARAGLLDLVTVAIGPAYSPYHKTSMTRTHTSSTITPTSISRPATPSTAREAKLALAEYLLDSDFAEVLGAGLGALYGLLPSKLFVRTSSSTTSPGKESKWDDNGVNVGSSGMVLGGMGSLGDEEDAEEVERKKEEEEDRLRAMGVGVSGTEDFSEGLDGWLKLVEFTQEVLRRSPVGDGSRAEGEEDEDEEARQQRLITTALTSSILTAVKTLLLQSVIYPSILECSESDGSAVAVLSYLDAMLGVLDDGTKLEGVVLGYLMGEDDVPDLSKRLRHDALLTPSPKRVRRRKSSALVLIESSSPNAQKVDSASYFTSLGRFSLKDLLVSNVHASSQPTATAALKLLQTLLTKHDRWSMGLLDVVLDESATSFPIALRTPYEDDSEEEEDEATFEYKLRQEPPSDSDDEVFVYPGGEPSSITSPTTPRAGLPSTPHRTPAQSRPLLGSQVPSTPSISTHLDSLDTLLSLIASIDPSYRSARAMGGGSEILSTGFANYLKDAEEALANDQSFRRGVNAPPDLMQERVDLSPQARRRSTLFGALPSLTARDFANVKTGFRHRLPHDATLLALLLDSLSHFFSHSPDLNLALTAVISSLAICPYRSLDGWLLQKSMIKQKSLFSQLVTESKTKAPASDDGDDRSVDYDVDERGRHEALITPSRTSNPTPIADFANGDSLLAILAALASSISEYRSSIPKFDVYLSERRQGLMFVENLADALDLNDDGNAFGTPLQKIKPLPVQLPTKAKSSRGPGFGAFLSPRPSHSRTSSMGSGSGSSSPAASSNFGDPFSTPPRQVRKSASIDSLQAPSGTRSGGPVSPFAAHYRQTSAISIKPIVVSTPRRSDGGDAGRGATSDSEMDDGAPDTPTKRLSSVPKTTPSVFSEGSERGTTSGSGNGGSARKSVEQPQSVTLSAILDNVILLEEFIKELAGIVHVRRSLGIDGVTFL